MIIITILVYWNEKPRQQSTGFPRISDLSNAIPVLYHNDGRINISIILCVNPYISFRNIGTAMGRLADELGRLPKR